MVSAKQSGPRGVWYHSCIAEYHSLEGQRMVSGIGLPVDSIWFKMLYCNSCEVLSRYKMQYGKCDAKSLMQSSKVSVNVRFYHEQSESKM
jgi:hypothetical protein